MGNIEFHDSGTVLYFIHQNKVHALPVESVQITVQKSKQIEILYAFNVINGVALINQFDTSMSLNDLLNESEIITEKSITDHDDLPF